MKRPGFLFFLAVMLAAPAQKVPTNESTVRMVRSGLGEGLILSMVQGQPGKYSLNPDELVRLKETGVSEKVLAAMAAKGSGATNRVPCNVPSAAAPADPDIPQGIDIGVY